MSQVRVLLALSGWEPGTSPETPLLSPRGSRAAPGAAESHGLGPLGMQEAVAEA